MRYGGSQQSPEKFIIFHAPTKNDRSHGRFLLSSRALSGDSHIALLLRMTEYFVRNRTIFCLPKSNNAFNIHALCYCVQRTLCHSEELHSNDVRIPRKGTLLQTPRKILLYLRGEKAHTSIRVSIVAPDNAISKVQCAPYGRVSTFFPCRACFYCFLYNCQYDTLAKYMTDCNNFRNHINH